MRATRLMHRHTAAALQPLWLSCSSAGTAAAPSHRISSSVASAASAASAIASAPSRRFSSASASAAAAAATPLTPSRTALVFPGQGSQRCGAVVRDLENEWPSIVRPVWQEMDEALQKNLSKIMKDGLASELQSTELAQPSILAHSYALWLVLRRELGLVDLSSLAHVTLGHSLGEYTSLVAAGSLGFGDAIRLVSARGTAMKHATRPGEGGMAALLCDPRATELHVPSIQALLAEAQQAHPGKVVQIANVNSPFQIVISGHTEAVDYVKQRVNQRATPPSGGGAASSSSSSSLTRGILKAVSLDVSGPFHSSLMGSASTSLAEALGRVEFHPPVVPVIFNVHGHASVKSDRFAEYLQSQLLQPVQWHPSVVHAMLRMGVSEFLELGPSTPLSAMLKSAAVRLAKQTHVHDPLTTHPADAGEGSGTAASRTPPHPSVLPLLMPTPRIILDDHSRTDLKDTHSILAGLAPAWGQVRTVGVSAPEDMRHFLRMQANHPPTET